MARTHLGCRCSLHLCRWNASPVALGGSFGITSNRCTNGCDHAQSEHLHLGDSLVGDRIVRVVSSMLTTLRPFSGTGDVRIPTPPNPASNGKEIRFYVTSGSRHLIAALHNILSNLELTEVLGRDQESFADLNRILRQRIQVLENGAPIPSPAPKPANIPE